MSAKNMNYGTATIFGAVEDWVSELMVPAHEDYLR